jgi:hypothetical protein
MIEIISKSPDEIVLAMPIVHHHSIALSILVPQPVVLVAVLL